VTRPIAFLCDFDGTVSPHDIGASLVKRFGRSASEVDTLLERWRTDAMSTREVIAAECATLRMSETEALDFSRGFELDPGFAPFVRQVRAAGGEVMVLSEGYGLYVGDQLARAGLGDVPWAANRLRFAASGVSPEFPFTGGCGRCGNCKAAHVRRHQERGYEAVLVGDGLSDRCGARAADRVLARHELLAWCAAEGIAATPFHDFADVAAWARARMAAPPVGSRRAAGASGG
jgi:2,3-diketo-5-methylthio-1-phosphopentane phosphatase